MTLSVHLTRPRREALDAVQAATRSIAGHLVVDGAIRAPEASTALAQHHERMLLALEQVLRFAQWLELQSLELWDRVRMQQETTPFSPFFQQLFGAESPSEEGEDHARGPMERELAGVDAQIQALDRMAASLADELLEGDTRLLGLIARRDHASVARLVGGLIEAAEQHTLALGELAGGAAS